MNDDRIVCLNLGVGGTIIQYIESDGNDSGMWDVANSKIINIQLIDARTFRKVIGLPLSSMPITAEMYAEAGLSFFELWQDEVKEAGLAGQWGELMGVEEVLRLNMLKSKDITVSCHDKPTNQRWGLISIGAWDRIDGSEEEGVNEEYAAAVGTKFNFPLVLLDSDDILLLFKSVAQDEDMDLKYSLELGFECHL